MRDNLLFSSKKSRRGSVPRRLYFVCSRYAVLAPPSIASPVDLAAVLCILLIMLMRRAGYSHFVPHGFRSSFRDWAAEIAKADRQTAEAALAHRIASGTEAAYLRSKLFDARKGLMSEWAEYCLAIEKPRKMQISLIAAARAGDTLARRLLTK